MKQVFRKVLSAVLVFAMIFCLLPAGKVSAEENGSVWTEVTDIAAAAASEKSIAITMTKGSTTWALPTAAATSSGPAAPTGTVGTDGKLTLNGVEADFGWTITAVDDGYTITNAGGKYLYVTASNNGVRVNNKPNVGYVWSITSNYLTASDSNGATRYLGVYNNQDWRCYTSINSNITGQTLKFWEVESAGTPEETTPVDKLTTEPGEGGQVVIYYPADGLALTANASGAKLAGLAGTVTDGKLGKTDSMAYMTTHVTDGVYTFELDGKYLTCPATGNGLSFATAESDYSKWTLEQQTDGTWHILSVNAQYNNTQQALEYYNGFTTYGVGGMTSNPSAYKFDFYGVAGSGETPVTVATPTASPEPGEVEAGTVVTFSCATEGAVISYSTDDGATWTEGNTYTVNEAVTLQVKAVKDGVESAVATFAYTILIPEPETVPISTALAGANGATFTVKGVVTLVDGKNIYIQDETGGIDLYFSAAPSDIALGDTLIGTGTSAVYRGLPELSGATYQKSSGLTLTAKTATIGALTTADVCTYVKLTGLEVTEVYDNNGGYANPNITFKDADNATIQLYKAVVGKTDGEWDVKVGDTVDITAAVGINNSTLQLRNTLATEITVKADVQQALVTDLAQLTDGATVVIFNPAKMKALSQTMTGNYMAGVDITITDGLLAGYGATEMFTVIVNDDGTYSFADASGNKLGMQDSYSSTSMGAVNDKWTVTAANTENCFYFQNTVRGRYLEWYDSMGDWSTYSSINDEALFAQQMYIVPAEVPEPPTPQGDTFGLASTLETGDQVILYNASNGVGLGNTMSGYKVAGVALTPVEGVITTDNTAVVWTVTKNSDGTVTFTQGGNTLGGVVSGNYRNLVLTGATSSAWSLTGPDSEDFNYYLYLADMAYQTTGYYYLEYYNGFTLYGQQPTALEKGAFGITFYKKGADPETPSGGGEEGSLVTSLSQMTEGAKVLIYSPTHGTAVSSKPNGDWYLKAQAASLQDGAPVNFTKDLIWTVHVDGSVYSFSADYDGDGTDECVISVWPSGTYAELTVNPEYNDETVHGWNLSVFSNEDHTWRIKSSTLQINRGSEESPNLRDVYIEAYLRNGTEVFSGYAPFANQLTSTDFALQFYLVDPTQAVEGFDDGEWDHVLNHGDQIVIYNQAAESSLGLMKEATYSLTAIPTEIIGGQAVPGNGAYAFRVNNYNNNMGRYYGFEVNGKYLATNNDEELFLVDPLEDGKIPENAKWFLTPKEGGYIIYNKDASYGGTPVCIEYFSSVFSGWTYSPKNDLAIYLFNFYKPVEGTQIYDDIVQDPSVIFDCEDFRYKEQNFRVAFTLDDLAETVSNITITYTVGDTVRDIIVYEVSSDGKAYSFMLAAEAIDLDPDVNSFTIDVTATNSYGITYAGQKIVMIVDEPFFEEMMPSPNSQTGEDLQPVIALRVGNVGDAPVFTMTLQQGEGEAAAVPAVYDAEQKMLVYVPEEDLALGRATVTVNVTRADGKTAGVAWSFTVGSSDYQLYFGQLHSHTTYSDGSGSLETALEYIASMPVEANIQFVAFTDHSNYFDTTSAANPADALNDKTLMTPASLALWNEYKGTIANFNTAHANDELIALGGFEMTWSGGPGHINTFDSDGLVSRNNAALNNKTGDAGMKLYYETVNKGESLNQFNHPGTTFGNFTDFSYWDEETDAHFFLVEVGNGEGQIGAGGYYPSYEQYTLALDKGWHLAPTNNQDNHKGRWGNANDARDVILTNDFSEQGIYDAIRALRLYATEDKNLTLSYTVNGEPMGTIFADGEAPETLNIEVTFFDPNATDKISKVELVANSATVVHTWSDAEELAGGYLSLELTPEYSYYFIRVTQDDGDLAVTAPVWVGKSISVGITDFTAAQNPTLVNEPVVLTTSLFNNEAEAVTVTSLVYTVDGSIVAGTDTTGYTIAANGTLEVPFTYTPDTAKIQTVTVTAVVQVGTLQLTYTKDLELTVRESETLEVSPIAEVRAQTEAGFEFAIEGIVTSNASGYDKDTAFFDCIYVQDETAGICCFPVSGEYKIGDKVHIEGYTDFYQGEPELQVNTIEVIGEGTIEPTVITAAELNDRSAEGLLVTVEGTVDSFEVVNGLIQTIMVRDENGDLARVFIDGYITTENEVVDCAEGVAISATGLASYDDTFNAPEGPFPRIRIRNRADIVCTPETPAETVQINGMTLSLEGKLGIQFYITAPESAATATLVFHGQKETTVTTELIRDADHGYNESNGQFRLAYVNIAMKEMTCPVTLSVFDAEGNALEMIRVSTGQSVGTSFDYKVVDWANTIIASSTNEKSLQMAKALLHFGGAAQNYFDFNLENFANPENYLADEAAALEPDPALTRIVPEGQTAGYQNFSLNLEGDTQLRIYFSKKVTACDENGKAYKVVKSGSKYYISIPDIAGVDLDKMFIVRVPKTSPKFEFQFSALSYANAIFSSSNEATADLARALYLYNQAAENYFAH
nr:hypothetical protein [Lachnospiraceae bacterium]